MLHILRLPQRAAALSVMESFDSSLATWVVSDLRSKQEVQQQILAKHGGYEDTSVMRASDLWKLLLKRSRPELQIVSRDFIRSVVRAYLEKSQHEQISSDRAVLSAMDKFAGIVFHPQGEELMDEWFEAHPEAKERWGKNFVVAQECLLMLRDQHHIVTAKWAAAMLQDEPALEQQWRQPLIVDLGADMTGAEAQLFLRLSKNIDVTLLKPDPAWAKDAEGVLRPYQEIEGAASSSKIIPPVPLTGHARALRLSGQLSEVKCAVSVAREWLDAGVSPEEIAIVAPEIEEYWPVLRSFLREEGIPADKPVAVKMNSFPSVNRWLARLRPRRGEVTAADLELAFYSSDASHRLRHEEFRALFANLYGAEDLKRHNLVSDVFHRGPKFAEQMKRDEFVMAVAFFWDDRDAIIPLQQIWRELLQNASAGMILPVNEWIRYLEAIASSREANVEPAQNGGVIVTNLTSVRSANLRRRIFLGLTEEGLRKADLIPIPLSDIAKLSSELGFHVDHPDQSALEFELRWLLDSPCEEDVLLMGVNTFDGSVRAPSALWLRLQRQENSDAGEGFHLPGDTRWDLLQKTESKTWSDERHWAAGQGDGLKARLEMDLGDIEAPPVKAPLPQKISPSLVQTFLDCPFKIAATSLFRLKSFEEIDLDVASRGLGTLSHAIFQNITDRGWTLDSGITDAQIVELIEEQRQKMNLMLAEENWWGPFLKRQIRVVKKFMEAEAAWKKEYKSLKLWPSEQPWTLYFDPTAGTFGSDATEGSIKISGRIDRLESDGGDRFVVVDYKSSATRLHDQKDWFTSNDLQLLFYMWALEKGAVQGMKGEVIGAFYYVYRDFSRNKGFQIQSEAGKLFPAAKDKSKKNATEEDKKVLFAELENKIAEVIRSMGEGAWGAKPRDEDKLCGRCEWNGLCRAPHLN